jgi:hypothetical protein
VLLGHGPNKAFLVPDLYTATERNGNNISSDRDDTTFGFSYFHKIWICFGLFDIAG